MVTLGFSIYEIDINTIQHTEIKIQVKAAIEQKEQINNEQLDHLPTFTVQQMKNTELILKLKAEKQLLVTQRTDIPNKITLKEMPEAKRFNKLKTESKLFMNLREKHAFTYGSYSSVGNGRWQSTFSSEAQVRSEKADSAIAEIFREIEKKDSNSRIF